MDVEKVGAGNAERNSVATTTTNIRPLNYLPPKRITMQNAVKRSPGFKRISTVLEGIIVTVKNVGRR